jgi:hypothetical protein
MSNKLPYARAGERGVTNRLQDELNVLAQMRDYAHGAEVNAVFVLGDLFDKRLLDAVTLRATVEAFSAFAPTPVFVLPGNHDADTHKGERFTAEVFEAMRSPHIKYMGEVRPELVEPWLRFWPLPYMPIEETRKTLRKMDDDARRKERGVTQVLLFHQAILGCGHSGWTCDDGLDAEEVVKGYNLVLSGHFHLHQKFGEAKTGMYLGAPMQHHFGDAGDFGRGFWDMSFTQGAPHPVMNRIPSDAPQFHTVNGLEFSKADARTIKKGDYIRFMVECTTAEWAAKRAEAENFGEKMRERGYHVHVQHKPVYHIETRMDSAGSGSMASLIGKYLDVANTDGLDKKRLLALGREVLEAAGG